MMQPHDAVQDEALPAGGTTPVPNDLLDRVMPALRDTELRVLLVVVRQTLGWQAWPGSAQRKERDWMTQSQPMRRTGRASEAVSAAVDRLVRARLIVVQDKWGRPLAMPSQRRRFLGKLYYRLQPELVKSSLRLPESEHAKPNITKESKYKNIGIKHKNVDKPVEKYLVLRGGGWKKVTKPHNMASAQPADENP